MCQPCGRARPPPAADNGYVQEHTPSNPPRHSTVPSLLFQIVIFDSFSGSQEPEPEHLLGSQQDDDAYVPLTGMRGSSGSTLIRRGRNNLCLLPLQRPPEPPPSSDSPDHSLKVPMRRRKQVTSVEFHRPSFKLPVQLVQGRSPVLPLPPPNREGFGLKLILAYDESVVRKLTAWRDTADAWRGLGPSPGLKRGNIVYFEST